MGIEERKSDCIHYEECLWLAAKRDRRHMKCLKCDEYDVRAPEYAPELFDIMTKGEEKMEEQTEYKTAQDAPERQTKMETKQCKQCGETKPLELFHLSKKGLQGRDSKCRACKAINSKAWADRRGGWAAVRKNKGRAVPGNPHSEKKAVENTQEFPQIQCRPVVAADAPLVSFDRERLARAIGITEAIMPEFTAEPTMLAKATVVIAVYRNLE